MPNKSTETYRKILDTGDVTANAVSALLVEKLGKEVEAKNLRNIINSTKALIKSKNDQLIDSLQRADNS
tara:strand:+ start:242 stop:448 length:207 start_codon:yes stop_codon:yes gene_type:complete